MHTLSYTKFTLFSPLPVRRVGPNHTVIDGCLGIFLAWMEVHQHNKLKGVSMMNQTRFNMIQPDNQTFSKFCA